MRSKLSCLLGTLLGEGTRAKLSEEMEAKLDEGLGTKLGEVI
jgi:hypothetical protein